MAPAEQRTESPGITEGDDLSGDNREHNGPEKAEKEATGSVMAHGHKPEALGKVASKRKGKQPKKHRDEGGLSKLPDMPLDILYEVRPGVNSVTDDGRITTPP